MRALLLWTIALAIGALAAPAPAHPRCETTPADERLSVTFFGVSTILLRAGNEAIMIDGFFSRPSFLKTAFTLLDPDPVRIERGLAPAGRLRRESEEGIVGEITLLALLVAQAHHDHSMDAAQVATRTGARLLGSPSTIVVARRGGFEVSGESS